MEYKLDPEDVASARLLAIGIRPRLEFMLFVTAVAMLLAWSVSPWSTGPIGLIIGLTAGLGAFRLMQISKVRVAAMAAFRRNPTLRQMTDASWNERGVIIAPAGSLSELIPWTELRAVKVNDRIVLLQQKSGSLHAIPKRAFTDPQALSAFRASARRLASQPR